MSKKEIGHIYHISRTCNYSIRAIALTPSIYYNCWNEFMIRIHFFGYSILIPKKIRIEKLAIKYHSNMRKKIDQIIVLISIY